MSDQYTRVDTLPDWDQVWGAVPGGAFKVVPADAIVIERGELPEVVADKSVVAGPCARGRGEPADDVRREGLALLAIAEYLAAHPPIDEAQVEALAQALVGSNLVGSINARAVARHLIAKRWSKPGVES